MKIFLPLLIVCALFSSGCGEQTAKNTEFTANELKSSIRTCFQNKNFKALLKYQVDNKKAIKINTEFKLVDTITVNNIVCYINPRNKEVFTKPDASYAFAVDIKYPASGQALVTIKNEEVPSSYKTRFGNELHYEYDDGAWKLTKQQSYIDN